MRPLVFLYITITRRTDISTYLPQSQNNTASPHQGPAHFSRRHYIAPHRGLAHFLPIFTQLYAALRSSI